MWFRSLPASWKSDLSQGRRPQPKPARRSVRLVLEHLEDRSLPSSYSAATASDLIADIKAANTAGGANTITLTAPTTSPYVLSTGRLSIVANDNLTIAGNGDIIERSTASGTPLFGLLGVAPNASLTLQNLTLQDGDAIAAGGAIVNGGTLALSAVTVKGNTAVAFAHGSIAFGGGIVSSGFLTLENGTVLQNNVAYGGSGISGQTAGNGGAAFGGALYVSGGTVSISDTTFSGNAAVGGAGGWDYGSYTTYGAGGNAYGGAMYVAAGQVTITTTTLTHNSAVSGGGTAYDPNPNFGSIPYTGPAGSAFGGALCVAGGTVTLSQDTVEYNSAQLGHSNYFSVPNLVARGGGIYIVSGATVYLDAFTFANTIDNSNGNIVGTYIET